MSVSVSDRKTSRIAAAFEHAASEGRAALVAYLTAGFPDRKQSLEALIAIAEAGADVIELGIPFSDPMADGPTIQASSFQALEAGMTSRGTLALLREFRESYGTPIVLFTYLNPVFRYGLDAFLEDATSAGADGLLLTDLPLGADDQIETAVRDSALDLVRLVAPTTDLARVPEIAAGGEGFLYYISRTGVTGARSEVRETLGDEVEAIKSKISLPVAVGFGISTPEQAGLVARVADGIVVGSALVAALEREGPEGARRFVEELRAGMDRAQPTALQG